MGNASYFPVTRDHWGHNVALRLDTFDTASFAALGGEGFPAKSDLRVGECSYKVFLDIGGQPKKKTDPWPDNNFPTCFVLCPRSNVSALQQASMADNPRDLAVFIALQAQIDAWSTGASGVNRFNTWVANNRKDAPPSMTDAIIIALHKYSYSAATTGRYRDAQALN